MICNKCGKKINLKENFNSSEDNIDFSKDIAIFTLYDGTVCVSCSCGNEIYDCSVEI